MATQGVDYFIEDVPDSVPVVDKYSDVDIVDVPEYDFAALDNMDDERSELSRMWMSASTTKGVIPHPDTLAEYEQIKGEAEKLGLSIDDVIADAEEGMSFGAKWASRLYRNGGPVYRGAMNSADSTANLILNLGYRGLSSVVPGWENLSTKADELNRSQQVSQALSDTLNREGDIASVITPTGSAIMGGAAQAVTDVVTVVGTGGAAAGARLSAPQAMKLTAGYYGLRRAEQELTVATDHNMSPTMRYAHAGMMGGLEGGLTLLGGKLASKYGVATAEEAAAGVFNPAVKRLMQRKGLEEAALGMTFEFGEEAAIAASQMGWGSYAGTDTMDEGFERVVTAGATGAATRGLLELPPAMQRFRQAYLKTQDAMPDTIKGTAEAQAAHAEGREPVVPEGASEDYKEAVSSEFQELSKQREEVNKIFDEIAVGEQSLKARIDGLMKAKQDMADTEGVPTSADTETDAVIAQRDALVAKRKDAEFRKKEIEQALAELNDMDKSAIKSKVFDRLETSRITKELDQSREVLTRAENTANESFRAAYGFDKLPEADWISTKESLRRAREKGLPQRALEIADEVVGKQRAFKDADEQNGVLDRLRIETEDVIQLTLKRDALPEGDVDTRKAFDLAINEAKNRSDHLSRALGVGGTEGARVLAMRRYNAIDELSPGTVRTTAEKVSGGPLTAEVNERLTKLAVELSTVEERKATIDRPTADEKPPTLEEFIAREIKRAKATKGGPLTEAEAASLIESARKLYENSIDVAALDRQRQSDAYDELDMESGRLRAKLEEEIQALEPKTFTSRLAGANNFLRGLLTGGDLLPLFRQGVTHPIRALKELVPYKGNYWKIAFGGEKSLFLGERALRDREYNRIAEKATLATSSKANQFELFNNDFLRNFASIFLPEAVVKRLPNLQKANNFIIRKIRADAFDAHVNALGGPSKLSDATLERIAKFENAATGFGTLGGFESSAKALSQLMIGPRFFFSRLQYMTFIPLIKAAVAGDKVASKVMAKTYAKQLAGLGLMVFMAEYFGKLAYGDDAVEFDYNPLSTNVGRLRIGNTVMDITGGLARPYRYFNSLTDSVRSKAFNRPEMKDPARSALGIATSALAPLPGLPIAAAGSYMADATPQQAAAGYLLPWTPTDMFTAFKEEGIDKATAIALLQVFGAGGYMMEK